jgi:hypothetical protein
MNRAGLIVVIIALVLAVVTAWTPAEAQGANGGQQGNVAIAAVIDASVKSSPLLSEAARDQNHLRTLLAGRDLHVVDMRELLDSNQADTVSDVLNSSDVLNQDVLLVQTVARNGGPLSDLLAAHNIPADRVVAVSLTDDTAAPVTVYLFDRAQPSSSVDRSQ